MSVPREPILPHLPISHRPICKLKRFSFQLPGVCYLSSDVSLAFSVLVSSGRSWARQPVRVLAALTLHKFPLLPFICSSHPLGSLLCILFPSLCSQSILPSQQKTLPSATSFSFSMSVFLLDGCLWIKDTVFHLKVHLQHLLPGVEP